jgi:hypothetical protein
MVGFKMRRHVSLSSLSEVRPFGRTSILLEYTSADACICRTVLAAIDHPGVYHEVSGTRQDTNRGIEASRGRRRKGSSTQAHARGEMTSANIQL